MTRHKINDRLFLELRTLGYVLIHTAEDGKTESVIPLTENDAEAIYTHVTGRFIR